MAEASSWISPEQAVAALERGTGRGVRVALLDSGVEWGHEDLRGARRVEDCVIEEIEGQFQARPGSGEDVFGHGTAVAGILREVAPEVEIGSFRVLDMRNQSQSEMICYGAHLAIERGYHVLNCSFGARHRPQVLMFKDWVDRAYLGGVHVVSACNNDDFRKPEWPGDFGTVITVNMLDTPERGRLFRNNPGTMVEFAALGVNVEVPWKGGLRREATGSSFAAPRVAGLLARLLSVFPRLTPVQAKALLHHLAGGLPQRPRLRLPSAPSRTPA